MSANGHRLSFERERFTAAETPRLNWSQLGSRIVQAGLAAAAIDLCTRHRDPALGDSDGALQNERNDSGDGRRVVDG